MADFDSQTILQLGAALAGNAAAYHAAQYDMPWAAAPLQEQFSPSLTLGLVAFVGRLTAALPPDFDLHPILQRFCADPAVAASLLGQGDPAEAANRLAQAFLDAGMSADRLDRGDFDDALAAFTAAVAEVARLSAGQTQQSTPLAQMQTTRPSRDLALQRAMAELVGALAVRGLDRISAGQVFAGDGTTVLYAWSRGHHGAREPATSAATEETSGGDGVQEALAGSTNEVSTAGEIPAAPSEPPSTLPPPAPAAEPPPPSPAPAPAPVVGLRLDAAAPPQVTVGRTFDLAVAIRRPDSPPLAPADLTQRESSDFAVVWPTETTALSMRIQISAPGCDISGGDTRQIRLLAGSDGPAVYFQLTPRQPGPLSLIITVYQETDWIGSTRLLTEVGGATAPGGAATPAGVMAALATTEPRGGLTLTVASQPLAGADVNDVTLRRALDDGYSDDELRDVVFELGIDYDDLPGQSQSAKARELVRYARRNNLHAALVSLVMRDRPHMLVAT